jgi:hypothetical protein
MSGVQPFEEPLRVTLFRNAAISLAVGAVAAAVTGRLALLPMVTLLALWPSLGGHYVEVFYRNWLARRLASRRLQMVGRLVTWFAAGIVMAAGMSLTALSMDCPRFPASPLWWLFGLAFIGIELAIHLILFARKQPSLYDGLG